MEIQLAMLRNSRPEAERMTVEEANQTLDDQVRYRIFYIPSS
jgi:hypothetical protein